MLSDRGTVLLLYSNYNTIATMEVFLSFQLSCDRGYCTVLFFPTTRQSQPHCYFFHIQLSCDRGHCAIFFRYQTIEATCYLFLFQLPHNRGHSATFYLFPPTIPSRELCSFFYFPLQLPYNRGHDPTFFHFQQP